MWIPKPVMYFIGLGVNCSYPDSVLAVVSLFRGLICRNGHPRKPLLVVRQLQYAAHADECRVVDGGRWR